MKILVVGTPKRDFSIGFDTAILGISKIGVEVDHYPNILTESYGHTGTYELKFDGSNIAYPSYQRILRNLKEKKYDLLITTVCRVDYNRGRYGIFSRLSRRFKYSLSSNKHKMGGTLVLDWLRQGIKLPPVAVIDDIDDPFIHPVDFGLLLNSIIYFKRELPFNRFLCFRLKLGLSNQELLYMAKKLRPIWTGYDRESIAIHTNIDCFTPFAERDIDIVFLGSTFASYTRQMILPILDKLESKYKIVSPKSGRRNKKEFYETLKRSKITVSLDGRGWDAPKHYELPLCGGLLFLIRPTIELAVNFKDKENCVFIDNRLSDFESLAAYYLSNAEAGEAIARRGYELAKNELSNIQLANYILKTVSEAIQE